MYTQISVYIHIRVNIMFPLAIVMLKVVRVDKFQLAQLQ